MLRHRFLLAFLPLPLLFLSVGFYAVYVLGRLEYSIKEIVNQNLDSVIAAEKMQAGSEQMYRGVVLSLQGADQEAAAAFRSGMTNFEQNLKTQFEQASLPGESNVTWQLERTFEKMRSAGQAVLDGPLTQRVSQSPFFVSSEKARSLTEEIRRMNRDAMRSNAAEAESTRQSSTVVLILMMTIATLFWLLVSARLAREILRPIRAMIHSIQGTGGDLSATTVTRVSPDEMGVLVQEFNKMSARLGAYRNSTAATVVRAQRMLHATLAAMPDPVYVVNQELRLELRNAAAKRLDDQEGTGEGLPSQLAERAREVIQSGQDYLPNRFQQAIIREVDNEPRYFLPKILIMRGEQQESLGAAIVMEDVTQFRLLDELKSNFVSTVSHEIKTPLTSIRMAVHLLQEGTVGPIEPRQAALLKTAREDIERLLRLLNNLLDVARFEHGSPQMYWEQACVCGLVEEAVKEVQTLAESRKLTLKVECPYGLPDLYIDRARVHHVLRNLLTNAIKHSPEGDEILLMVSLAENGGIQFAVRDRGPGIPEQYRERIFERFFRVPGEKTPGTGLGLSIAREVIVAHTGTIGCQSDPGRETIFHFCLPTATEHQRRLSSANSTLEK